MSILDIFKGMNGNEIEELFEELDAAVDGYFSEHGDRRRFIKACRKLPYQDIKILQNVLNNTNSKSPIQLANEIANPLRTADALLMLEDELEKTNNSNFLLFLMSLIQKDKVPMVLDRARFFDWEYPLLLNKHLPEEFMEYIWNLYKNGRFQDVEYYHTRRIIAKHKHTPLAVLEELYEEDDSVIRKAIAQHKNINDSLINRFLNSKRLEERANIASSKFVSKEVLLSLMRDKYNRISSAARKQFNKRFPDTKITEDAINKAIKTHIKSPYTKPNKPVRPFNAYADVRMGIEHILSLKPSQRAGVAKVADADTLEALANDKSKVVRRAVAGNYSCPTDKLLAYTKEQDDTIVNNAILTISRKQPEIVLEELIDSDAIDYSYNLLNTYINQRANFNPLYEDLDIKTESEVERVYLVAQYTNNPMIQMRIISGLKEIPDEEMRRNLLSKLGHNHHLIDNVIRKIVFDLKFATERVMTNCKNQELVSEYLAQCNPPKGERIRLEKHLESIQSN